MGNEADPILDMEALATAMRGAASALQESLSPTQREAIRGPLEPAHHRDWTYLPGARAGLRLGDLGDEQLDLAVELLRTVHSARGYSDTLLVIRIEAVRRELSARRPTADPFRDLPYWIRILGDPGGRAPWAWRIGGHHLLAQATVVEDQVFGAPHFFGSEPATVDRGPHRGLRALPREEDLARELALSLQPDQRAVGVLSAIAPADILSRYDPVASLPSGPRGIAYARLDRQQRELFEALLRQYIDRVAAPVANRAWSDLTDAGLPLVSFGWAGPLERGGHYYALAGPSLLIEYDNTQDDANHIHSVWRDLRHDFGGDVLARHYAGRHRGSGHRLQV